MVTTQALGLGQWAKLKLWDLPVDRVIYLDADAVVLRDVSELFSALDGADLAAPYDYYTGGVIVLRTGTRGFQRTLASSATRVERTRF